MIYGWSSDKENLAFWIPCCVLLFFGIHLSRKDKVFIRMISDRWYLIDQTFENLEQELDPYEFSGLTGRLLHMFLLSEKCIRFQKTGSK
jgi:hypothetical protein